MRDKRISFKICLNLKILILSAFPREVKTGSRFIKFWILDFKTYRTFDPTLLVCKMHSFSFDITDIAAPQGISIFIALN